MVTRAEIITTILSATGIIGIPSLALLIRAAMKQQKIEDKLNELVKLEKESREEVDQQFGAVERELEWLRDKIWQIWRRGGRRPM